MYQVPMMGIHIADGSFLVAAEDQLGFPNKSLKITGRYQKDGLGIVICLDNSFKKLIKNADGKEVP